MPGFHQVLPFLPWTGERKYNQSLEDQDNGRGTSVTQTKSSESAQVYVTKCKGQGEKLDANHEKTQYQFNKEEQKL